MDAGVSLLLPCKPDKAQKQVPLGPQPTTLNMLGCEAGGSTFAVAVAELPDPAQVAEVLSQWQAITLKNMKAAPLRAPPALFKVAGADASPPPVWLQAEVWRLTVGRRYQVSRSLWEHRPLQMSICLLQVLHPTWYSS